MSISNKKSCRECGEMIIRNHKLEKHMVHTNGLDKTNKNQPSHANACPFSEVGSKFVHKEAEI